MKKALLIFSLLFGLNALCQYDIDEVKKDTTGKESRLNLFEIKQRTYVGGELGLSFGAGSSYLYLAPLVGYDITPKFSAGLSAMYQLYRLRDFAGNLQSFSAYGGGVFLRARPIQQLILQTEFDIYNTTDFTVSSLPRTNVPALMAGAGYAGGGGGSVYYQILVLYDFINNPNMPLPPLFISNLHLKLGLIWHLG